MKQISKAKPLDELDPKSPAAIHYNCNVNLIVGPFGPHAAKYVCLDHDNAFVSWVSHAALHKLRRINPNFINPKTYIEEKESKMKSIRDKIKELRNSK